MIKKSQVSFFFFFPLGFVCFLNKTKKSDTSPILLVGKQFVNSALLDKEPLS